jgi:TDG/mug DNA glycosylase family protein
MARQPDARSTPNNDSSNYESSILARDLDVIFCGINPAASAAAAGHNFSDRSNRFWRVLHLAGFTDVRLQPHDERRLLEYGCGITAVVCRPTRRADEISPGEFKAARLEFEAKMRRYAPRSIAFLGKRALSAMVGLPKVEWGQFPPGFAGMTAWILPNPSGLNRGFTLDALVDAYSELRRQL